MEQIVNVADVRGMEIEATEYGAVGLDVGTSRIVLSSGSNGHKSLSQLNAFVEIPYSRMTEASLSQSSALFRRSGKFIYVYGNDAEKFATAFAPPAQRTRYRGRNGQGSAGRTDESGLGKNGRGLRRDPNSH